MFVLSSELKASDECFEKQGELFKFNKGFDNAILEPIAKGYNKLPEPIRNGTSNFTSNVATLLSILTIYYKEILKMQVMRQQVF